MRTLVTAVALLSLTAFAQGGRRGPPPEALTACAGLSANTACAFTLGERNLTGTCEAGPDGAGALACRPEGMGGGRHHGPPPQQAVAACASQADGASCSFTHDSRTVQGTCRTGRDGAAACRPDHFGAPPPEATAACATLSAGASCSVTFGEHTLQGTCGAPPGSTTLACRPDHPRGPPPEATAACAASSAGAACTVSFHGRSLTGTCEAGPDGAGALACRPARPD